MKDAASSPDKEILLVDAVCWSEVYPLDHPLRSVHGWFLPHLSTAPAKRVRTVSAESDLSSEPGPQVAGVVISGSPRDAWNDDPVNGALCKLIERCHSRGIPLLGVCYGHQILGRALGGQVARHPHGWELGNVPIDLTQAGEASPLFQGFPRSFSALQSHADAVLTLPKGCELLATGAHTEIQSFSYGNTLFGVQFHPETRPDILRFLWTPRLDRWRGQIGFDIDHRVTTFQECPVAARVLHQFVHHIAL